VRVSCSGAQLIPLPRRNDQAVEKVAAPIKEFGFKQPIVVDKDSVIIVGHTRLLAALRLCLKEVPVLVAGDLIPAQVKAYRLADNRLHEETTWDDELLALELGDLSNLGFNLAATGFDADEINALSNIEQGGLLPGTDEDAVPKTLEKPTTYPGEMIHLGKHRMICGDSTDPFIIERLLTGGKADAIFTDPPYNVNYEGHAGKSKNDNWEDAKFRTFLLRGFRVMYRALKDGGAIYVCHADTEGLNFRSAFTEVGFKLAGFLIWCKDSLVLGRSDYQWQREPILYGWKPTGPHNWYRDRKSTTIASALNLEVRRVQQLANEGMPRETRGQYDLVKCMLWYIRYLQRVIEKKSVPTLDGGFVGEREARVRLLHADANLREMELAKESGQLLALSDVEAMLTDLVFTTKVRVLRLAPRLAPELVGETSRIMIQAKIEKACKEVLAYMARSKNK
jgi:hypothetical protein